MADQRHDAAFVVGAVIGGVTAAAVTLFRAPQSGARTRSQIRERVGPPTRAAAERGRTLAATTSGAVGTAQQRLVALPSTARQRLAERPPLTLSSLRSASPLRRSAPGATSAQGETPARRRVELVATATTGATDARVVASHGAQPPDRVFTEPAPLSPEERRAMDLEPAVPAGGGEVGAVEFPSAAAAAAALARGGPSDTVTNGRTPTELRVDGPRPANGSTDR